MCEVKVVISKTFGACYVHVHHAICMYTVHFKKYLYHIHFFVPFLPLPLLCPSLLWHFSFSILSLSLSLPLSPPPSPPPPSHCRRTLSLVPLTSAQWRVPYWMATSLY